VSNTGSQPASIIVGNYYFSGRSSAGCSAHFATSSSHNNSIITAADFARKRFIFWHSVNVYSNMKNQSTYLCTKMIMIIRFYANIDANSSSSISPTSRLAINRSLFRHHISPRALHQTCPACVFSEIGYAAAKISWYLWCTMFGLSVKNLFGWKWMAI